MPLYVRFILRFFLDFSVVLLTKSGQPHNQLFKNKTMTPVSDTDYMLRKTTVLVMLHDTKYSTKW